MRAALVLLLALFVLGGCGGDGEEGEGGPDGAPAGALEAGERGEDGGGAGESGDGEGASPGAEAERGGGGAAGEGSAARQVDLRVRPKSIRGARVTPTGAVQTLPPDPASHRSAQENMYGSIRSFGSEAEGAEATNITFALLQYLTAKASGDWATACARIYSVLRRNLESPGGEGEARSCPQTFGQMMSRSPQASRAEQARIDVSSVRRGEGNRAFVIYKTPQTLSADMPMYVEEGVWKVGALEAYALRPDQVG